MSIISCIYTFCLVEYEDEQKKKYYTEKRQRNQPNVQDNKDKPSLALMIRNKKRHTGKRNKKAKMVNRR